MFYIESLTLNKQGENLFEAYKNCLATFLSYEGNEDPLSKKIVWEGRMKLKSAIVKLLKNTWDNEKYKQACIDYKKHMQKTKSLTKNDDITQDCRSKDGNIKAFNSFLKIIKVRSAVDFTELFLNKFLFPSNSCLLFKFV